MLPQGWIFCRNKSTQTADEEEFVSIMNSDEQEIEFQMEVDRNIS